MTYLCQYGHSNGPGSPRCGVRSCPSNQPGNAPPPGHAGGFTYDPKLDYLRLNNQRTRVFRVMVDKNWHTLADIASATGDPESSISARIRDLRKPEFGSLTVDERRRTKSQWEYRLVT